LGIVGGVAALLVGLDTPVGHRLITDIIASNELDNGLRVSIGRIEGSIYGARACPASPCAIRMAFSCARAGGL
jgi:hypothetical protein